jgi:RHS repeat-associated protein
MLSDHLKSTSALVARNGVLNVKYFYYPYGARRGVPFNSITAKHFTGQYHEASLPGGEGLSFYNARWYDPKLGAFLSSDSIVPAPLDPQSFNRYAYAGGNPLRFSDPSGHTKLCGAACEDGYKWSPPRPGSGSPRPTPQPQPAPTPPRPAPTGTPNPGRPRGTTTSENAANPLRIRALTDPIWEWAKDELRTMMKPMPFQLLARMGIPTPEYTLVVDFGILGGAGVAGRTSVTGAVDSQGGMMTLFNIGGGGIAPIATSAGLTFGLSNARSVRSLPGNSVQIGGAFGVPAAVTGEVSIFRDQSTGVPYYSASVGGAAVA